MLSFSQSLSLPCHFPDDANNRPTRPTSLDVDTGSADMICWSTEARAEVTSRKDHALYDPKRSKTAKLEKGLKWFVFDFFILSLLLLNNPAFLLTGKWFMEVRVSAFPIITLSSLW